jgi:hypothetical protein
LRPSVATEPPAESALTAERADLPETVLTAPPADAVSCDAAPFFASGGDRPAGRDRRCGLRLLGAERGDAAAPEMTDALPSRRAARR